MAHEPSLKQLIAEYLVKLMYGVFIAGLFVFSGLGLAGLAAYHEGRLVIVRPDDATVNESAEQKAARTTGVYELRDRQISGVRCFLLVPRDVDPSRGTYTCVAAPDPVWK